jgi:hypothetical protein
MSAGGEEKGTSHQAKHHAHYKNPFHPSTPRAERNIHHSPPQVDTKDTEDEETNKILCVFVILW